MTPLHGMCPDCGRTLAGFDGMTFATVVVRRTCARCRARWLIVVRPLPVKPGRGIAALHELDFARVSS